MSDPETERLRFRKFEWGDLHGLASIRGDADVMRYIGSRRPESVGEVQNVLNGILAHWRVHGFGRWALIDRQSEVLIGWCGLSYLEQTREVEIGYGIAKPFWGKGLASEAASATMQYGFQHLCLDRIVAGAWPDNVASQHVMKKLGMRFIKQAQFYGADLLYYAISVEEYRSRTRHHVIGE